MNLELPFPHLFESKLITEELLIRSSRRHHPISRCDTGFDVWLESAFL